MSDAWNACVEAKYVSLETFRANGTGVKTPVWIAADQSSTPQRLIVWTVADSWKVKRVRKNSAVRMAPCTARGEVTGEWVDASAVVLDAAESTRVGKVLNAKYGIQSRTVMFFSRLRRGSTGTVCIAITQPK